MSKVEQIKYTWGAQEHQDHKRLASWRSSPVHQPYRLHTRERVEMNPRRLTLKVRMALMPVLCLVLSLPPKR